MESATGMAGLFVTQREWRYLILFAFFLGGLGAGLYIVSLILKFSLGMILGLLIVGIGKNACHVMFLGRPARFWRAVSKPGTSWISRGFIGIVLFCIFGLLNVLPYVTSVRWSSGLETFFTIVSVGSALWVMLYTGFVMATSTAIPAWNNAILPVAFTIYGFMGGLDVVLILAGTVGAVLAYETHLVELAQAIITSLGLFTVVSYVLQMSRSNAAGRQAVRKLFGELSLVFIVGVLVFGVIALGLLVISYLMGSNPTLMVLSGIIALIGSLLFRLSLLKAGLYHPYLS